MGGVSNSKIVTPEVADLVLRNKATAERLLGRSFATFNPVFYTTQVVAGIITNVKIQCDNDEYVHMKIFTPPGSVIG